MINFIRTSTKGHILGLFLLTIAVISAGCSSKAEATKGVQPPVQKREVAAPTPTPETTPNHNPSAVMPQDGDPEFPATPMQTSSVQLSKTDFEKIKVGMDLVEVQELMGDKGMLVSTMDVNGKKTQIYKWSNDNFTSYIDVTIEKNKVIEKKDKGLK
jgi:hypothetical protein